MRMWAFWRRVQYLSGAVFILLVIAGGVYSLYFYESPTCFDQVMNGNERGIDCGGTCMRICSVDVREPQILWVKPFKVSEGQYNVVAYAENRNPKEGAAALPYTLTLFDSEGVILERRGTTVMPPHSIVPIFEGRIFTGNRIPERTEIKLLLHDAVWQDAPDVIGQFTIAGRELRNADSDPKLVASITNRSLVEAQNVDIVATIFDSKGAPLTTSATFISNLSGGATREVVFTWPSPIAKTIRSCEIPTDIVLAIDLSGSMNDDGGNPPEPITSVLRAAEAFVSRLKQADQVSIVTYATEASIVENLTVDKVRAGSIIRGLTINPKEEVGSTNTGDAISRALEEFESGRHNPNARKVLVLLSDGLANTPGTTPEAYALGKAEELKRTDVDIYSIGLGSRINDVFMRSIASTEAHYLKAASAENVDTIYRSITSSLCEDGAAVIEIVPLYRGAFAPLR